MARKGENKIYWYALGAGVAAATFYVFFTEKGKALKEKITSMFK